MALNKKVDNGTFDKDMQDFLLDLEVSAKRIIKNSNKKRLEETQRERHRVQREKLGLPTDGKLRTASAGPLDSAQLHAQPTVLFGYPEKPFNPLGSDIQAQASMGTLQYGGTGGRSSAPLPTSPIQSPLRGPHMDDSPLPPLKQDLMKASLTKSNMKVLSSSSLKALPSVHSSTNLKKPASGARKPVISKKLQESPLFSESMASLLGGDDTGNQPRYDKHRPGSKGLKRPNVSMSMGSLSLGKGASSIMGGSSLSTLGPDKMQVNAENQGPISWSLDDLRVKYRGEQERESLYHAYREKKARADRIWREEGLVVSVAQIARHPVYAKLYAWLEMENVRSTNRSRARNKMKRFVHDVHQVWLTNLQHLKEFRLDKINQVRAAKTGGRRDAEDILRQHSQIQSVSPQEAVKDFIFPTHEPFVLRTLQASVSSASMDPSMEAGIGIKLAEEIPALPPPIPVPPDLKVLVECQEMELQSQSGGRLYKRHLIVHRLSWHLGDVLKRDQPAPTLHQASHGEGSSAFFEDVQQGPQWRIVAYDPFTGRESSIFVDEAFAIESVERLYSSAPRPQFQCVFRKASFIPIGDGIFKEPCLVEISVGEGTRPALSLQRGREMACEPSPEVLVKVYPLLRGLPTNRPTELQLPANEIWFRLYGEVYEAGPSPESLEFWLSPDRKLGDAATWMRLSQFLVLQLPKTQLESPEKGRRSRRSTRLASSLAPPVHKEEAPLALHLRCAPKDEWDGQSKGFLAARAQALLAFLRLESVPGEKSASDPSAGTLELPIFKTEQSSNRKGAKLVGPTNPLILRRGAAGTPQAAGSFSRLSTSRARSFLSSRASFAMESEWEQLSDFRLALSLRVCGKLNRLRVVPGLTAVGRIGVWRVPPVDQNEFTQAAGFFFRDAAQSSTDSVLVNIILALDTPEITPMLCAWDPYNQLPPAPPDEVPPKFFITRASEPRTLRQEPVISELDTRRACTCYLLTEAEIQEDFLADKDKGSQHRRFWKEHNPHFFRQKHSFWLSIPDPQFSNIIFGITRASAIGNSTGVTGRSIWHSEQRSVEQLVRLRAPKDYAYVTKNELDHGFYDPNMYHIYLDYETCREIWKGGLQAWESEMKILEAERIKKAKEEALAAKIKSGQEKLARRREREEKIAEKLKLKEQRRKRKAEGKDKSAQMKLQWNKRRLRSDLIATRGDWELRRDRKTGQFFYHCLDEFIPNPDQWDPPTGWELMAETQAPVLQQDATAGTGTFSATSIENMTDAFFETNGGLDNTQQEALNDQGQFQQAAQTAPPDKSSELNALVEELAGNSKLVELLAEKLGIKTDDQGLSQTDSIKSPGKNRGETDRPEKNENIFTTELDSDDDPWSDPDDIIGNASGSDLDAADLPQDHTDNWNLHVQDRNARYGKTHHSPEDVPDLKLGVKLGLAAKDQSYGGQVAGKGWRRLPKAHIATTFFEKATKAHTSGPLPGTFVGDSPNNTYLIGLMDPADVVEHDGAASLTIKPETMFIDNIVDVLTNLREAAKLRLKKEELLAEDISLVELLGGRNSEFLTSEKIVLKPSTAEVVIDIEDKLPELEHRAILATKNSNIQTLEVALDEGAPVDTSDSVGNTLLILAAQQGNKRVIKFLLRRGATMNVQNIHGNTALHYCFEYSHRELAEYLISKGADNSILNAEGMTCYEGLKRDKLETI